MPKLKVKKKVTSSLGIIMKSIKIKAEMSQITFQINQAMKVKKNRERPKLVHNVGSKADIPKTQDVRS